MWRGPHPLCFHGGDCEAACVGFGSGDFHPVGWCVVLQRHYGGGSRMAVAFFDVVRSVFLVSLLTRGRPRRRLHEVEKVVSRGPSKVALSV